MKWYIKVVKDNYINFNGRASREEYWMFVLFYIIFGFAISFIEKFLFGIYFNTLSNIYTLALLIHPVLVQLKNTTNSYPEIMDEDVYPEITDYEKKWEAVLQDMINTFAVYVTEEYWERDRWTEQQTEEFNRGLNYFSRFTDDNSESTLNLFSHLCVLALFRHKKEGLILFIRYTVVNI